MNAAPEIADRIREIIRRELKIGSDVELGDDVPLFDGSLDLDSLDALLLLQCVEREFGFRVSATGMDQGAFHSIRTLTRFVEQRAANLPSNRSPCR